MPMSPEAIAHDEQLASPKVLMKEIFSDPDFNSRGYIQAQDVTSLAEDIAKKGLMLPVIIRPLFWDETELKEKGFKYSLVAGFRRYMCYRINDAEKIPASIEHIANVFDAKDVNARENLLRKDLTLWQECMTIKHYWAAEWTREKIADRIGMSPGWVQTRIQLLEMAPEIQAFANDDLLTQADVKMLAKYSGKERLIVANRIRDLRKVGQKAVISKLKKPDKPHTKKSRSAFEIQEMMERIRQHCVKIDRTKSMELKYLITDQGNMILHRVLSWSTGVITTLDVHLSLRAFFELFDVKYELPKMDNDDLFNQRPRMSG